MVYKKINKKGIITMTSLVISCIIVIAIFFAAYEYITFNATQSGVTLDSKFGKVNTNITRASDNLDTNVKNIQANYDGVQEASSIYQVAVNGFKGLGNVLKLPINFLNTILEVFNSLLFFDIIPGWLIPLISTGLIVLVIFLLLKIMKGEQAM